MEAATLWLTFVMAAAAVAAAVFAFVQAKVAVSSKDDAESAQAAAEEARTEALRIVGEARDALQRSADALEQSNAIAREGLPKPKISWELQPVGRMRWMAQNVGDAMGFDARVEGVAGFVSSDDDEPRDVGPGDSLYFVAMSTAGDSARVRITCMNRDLDVPTETVTEITLP